MNKQRLFTGIALLSCLGMTLLCGCATSPLNQARDLSPVTILPADSHQPILVAERGKSAIPIVCMAPRTKDFNYLRQPMNELADCIHAITGVKPAISYATTLPKGPAIVIAGLHDAETAALPDDGFVVKTIGNKIHISGNDRKISFYGAPTQGTQYGIADFLERILDVRWYFPRKDGGRYTPVADRILVQPMHYTDHPRFAMRSLWPYHYDTVVTAMLRDGSSVPGWAGHTPRWKDEYMKTRPEIYQLRTDGSRQSNYLCYSNPKTMQTYLERLAEEKKGGRKATNVFDQIVAVSPDDAEVTCCCEGCKKLYDKSLGQYGNASPILENFAIKLAGILKRDYPGMKVGYLAYMNYSTSTGQPMPDNMMINVCSMPGLAMYKEPVIRQQEQANLDRWISVSSPLSVLTYQYCCWPEDRTPAPFQYPHVVQDFYRHNLGRINGCFFNGIKNHWARQHVTLCTWYRAMWNPEFDVEALMDEFADRLFGPAAQTIRELLTIECDGWEKSRWENGAFSLQAIHGISYPRNTVLRMKELTQRAYREIGQDPLLKKRLDFFTKSFQPFFQESDQFHSGNLLKPLLSQKVGASPKLDGKLDEPDWQRATPLTFIAAYDRKNPTCTYKTQIRSVWTVDGAFFGVHMEEPHPELLFTKNTGRDSSLAWGSDNVEMLLDPSGKNAGDFYHFILDAAGGLYDKHRSDLSWNTRNITFKCATGKDFWSMEIFVPWSEFPDNVPGSGTDTKWTGQFTRLRYNSPEKKAVDPQSKGEYSRMNTTFAAFSNNLADFADIKFVE